MANNNRRIAKNSLFMSFRMVVVLLISLFTTREILRVLGVTDYGIYNVVGGFVSLFSFFNTALSNGIQRFYNYELGRGTPERMRAVYSAALLIQSVMAVVVVIFVECVGTWYIGSKLVSPPDRVYAAGWVFQCAVASIVLVMLRSPYVAAVYAHEKFGFYAGVSVLDVLLKLLAVIALPMLAGDRLVSYGILMMSIEAVNIILYAVYAKKHFSSELKLVRIGLRDTFRSMLGFTGWNLVGSLSVVMREQGVNVVMNLFHGPVVNAARGVAAQVNAGLESFASNLVIPARPQVIQNYASGNLDRSLKLTYAISKVSCTFLIMLSIPLLANMDFVLTLWLGENVPAYTNIFTAIIISTSVINILMGATATLVHASGEMKNYQLWGGMIKMLSVPISYWLFCLGMPPSCGLIAVFVFNLLGYVYGLFVIRGIMAFSIRVYARKVIVPISIVSMVGLLSVGFIHLILPPTDWIRVVVDSFISIVSVGVSFYIFGLDAVERGQISVMIKEKLKRRFR